MSNNTVPQATDIHESLRGLYFADGEFDIREGYTGAAELPEGDPHRVDQDEKRSYKRGKDAYEGFAVVRAFDLRTGEEVKCQPEGWLEEQFGDWDMQSFWIRSLPNTYVINGEHLFVSGGGWVITGMTNTGDLEFTAWSKLKAEIQEEEDENRAEWLGANAESIAAVQPAWADASLTWVDLVTVDDDGEITPDMMEFRRNVGGVCIEQSCAIDDGVFSLMGEPEIRIATTQEARDGLSGDDAARIGVDMVAAAAVLGEYVTVSELRKTAVDAGVQTSVLLQMTEG